jgi:hypothetical protein
MSERKDGDTLAMDMATISGAENNVKDGEMERGTNDLGGVNACDFMLPFSVMETITMF